MTVGAQDVPTASLGIVAGHNPTVGHGVFERPILDALAKCSCKFMFRDAAGQHQEIQLGHGLRKVARRGTYCSMHLESENKDLAAGLSPTGLESAQIDRINLYISPPRSGAPLHFDTRWIIVVQLSGSKLWQVGPGPAVVKPRCNVLANEGKGLAHHNGEDLALPDKMRFVLLQAGDWLMVPWGTWHGTYSHNGSVSATLAFADDVQPELPLDFAVGNTIHVPEGPRLLC